VPAPPGRIAVLGIGLIGGSIGLAAAQRVASADVFGYDPDPRAAARAKHLGAIDVAADSIAEACEGAEVIFCAAPVGALSELIEKALAAAGPETVVTDVGSTKRDLVARHGGDPRFIGGHPLTGAETAGVEGAREDLFVGARWYLTPTEISGGLLYDRLQRTIAAFGARPQAIDAEARDRLMATVSHLPHLLAFSMMNSVTGQEHGDDFLSLAGPGFRDFTRIAASDPKVWRDILLSNRDELLAQSKLFQQTLRTFAQAMQQGDAQALEDMVTLASETRAHWRMGAKRK